MSVRKRIHRSTVTKWHRWKSHWSSISRIQIRIFKIKVFRLELFVLSFILIILYWFNYFLSFFINIIVQSWRGLFNKFIQNECVGFLRPSKIWFKFFVNYSKTNWFYHHWTSLNFHCFLLIDFIHYSLLLQNSKLRFSLLLFLNLSYNIIFILNIVRFYEKAIKG